MKAESGEKGTKSGAGPMPVPLRVHVYVWVFMVTLGVAPVLGSFAESVARGESLAPFMTAALFQFWFLSVQRLCSTDALSYWDGLLAAAFSVTTRGHLASFIRAAWLLMGVVILSVLYAACHDGRRANRHAGLRYGQLIIWLHRQRLLA